MDTQAITRSILVQRMERYTDTGPSLDGAGRACFRRESSRLRVAYASVYPGYARNLIRSVLRYVRPRGMSVQWSVIPELAGEAELGPALVAERFRQIEHLLLMARDGALSAPSNDAITVRPVRTREDMRLYERGSRVCFYDEPNPSDVVLEHRAGDRWREHEQGWCRYYLARIGDRLAGGCYVSVWEDVPTIMGVYTMPYARRQGVATALLAHTATATITPRKPAYCLYVEHGNPAELLYRRLGFAPLVDTDTYEWLPT
ncbi:MAG TPA: GNAT family N-acetyltransferase [Ktedonobacterales bacterium]|nr:GNAT family N-acetyltransferase [Ktedonobacterales bacterium]